MFGVYGQDGREGKAVVLRVSVASRRPFCIGHPTSFSVVQKNTNTNTMVLRVSVAYSS